MKKWSYLIIIIAILIVGIYFGAKYAGVLGIILGGFLGVNKKRKKDEKIKKQDKKIKEKEKVVKKAEKDYKASKKQLEKVREETDKILQEKEENDEEIKIDSDTATDIIFNAINSSDD